MITTNSGEQVLYILDSSVLIHDPESIFQFEEHKVAIPSEVLNELDKIKSETSLRGKLARQAQRNISKALGNNSNRNKLPMGGEILLILPPHKILKEGTKSVSEVLGVMDSADNKIVCTADWSKSILQKEGCIKATLVTKDIGMALKARACGVEVEDYRFDKVQSNPELEYQPTLTDISPEQAEAFTKDGVIEIPELQDLKLEINQYGLFNSEKKIPYRYLGNGKFSELRGQKGVSIEKGAHIKARNLEQLFLLDALLDPSIDLVTAKGMAGTGKTILTMIAGLHLIENNRYTGMCISKPIESVGKENGFLPGTIEDKMRPWLQPYADAINFLHRGNGFAKKRQSTRKTKQAGQETNNLLPYDRLTQAGIVEITAIEYIRGRSIPNRLFVLDEVQNVPQGIIKTIASRMAEGSKLVCLGDIEQIDNPYLDKHSNGLVHLQANMRNLPNVAHISLWKGERSLLAEQAAKLL
jgi:PhoH-like ATPase